MRMSAVRNGAAALVRALTEAPPHPDAIRATLLRSGAIMFDVDTYLASEAGQEQLKCAQAHWRAWQARVGASVHP